MSSREAYLLSNIEHGVVEVAEQQRVGDEAGLVAHDDGLLPEALGEGLDVLEHLVLGDDGAHDLDELQHRGGVEEVHADDALGVARGTAISVTGSEEVLVARIASGATMPSTLAISS